MSQVDNITPFNGCSIKIIGICVLNINPHSDQEYKAVLGIPVVAGHTPSISITQYDLNGVEQKSPSINLSDLFTIEETTNKTPSINRVKENLNPQSNNDNSSSRLISFSYLPNLSSLYQPDTIKINWSKMSYIISFKVSDGVFSTYQLETTDGTDLASVTFSKNGNQIQAFSKLAESIGFELAFSQADQGLLFNKKDGSSLLSLSQQDNLYTVVEITNIPSGQLPSGFEHFPFYYDQNIITDNAGNPIPNDKQILPSLASPTATAPVYCSPLVTSTNNS